MSGAPASGNDDYAVRRLTAAERRSAWLHGWRDGRRRIPPATVEAATAAHAGAAGAPVLMWTSYIERLRYQAAAAGRDFAAQLVAANLTLIAEVYTRADAVVIEYDRGQLSPGTETRFTRALTQWRGLVAVTHHRAEQVVVHANQHIAHYWAVLVRYHQDMRDEAARRTATRPVTATVDPIWTKPEPFLLLLTGDATPRDDEATAMAYRRLIRALDIVANSIPAPPTPPRDRTPRDPGDPK
jgi:hypothetical protein